MLNREHTNKVSQTGNTLERGDLAGRDIIKPIYNIGKANIGGQSQLEKLYIRLEKEKQESRIFSEIIDELMHFKTCVDGVKVIGLEKKLIDANRQSYLIFAEDVKERFTRKLLRNEYSESAQLIFAFLLAKVYSSFQNNVYPRIVEGHPEEFINSLINDYIINPLEEILGDNLLRIYEDEINGMIYFLTGNCHIKWI